MRLVALQTIRDSVGQISEGQAFDADGNRGAHLIATGAAATEADYARRPWSGRGYWNVQPEWHGESVCILGGGPSVTPAQVEQAAGCKIIAINNAVQLAPDADILYFCDARWYRWHAAEVQAFAGMRVTLENLELQRELDVRCLRDYGVNGFAPKPDGVTNGRNGGFQALHLAAWLGAARVQLLGYDMRAADDGAMHWHAQHPVATPPTLFAYWLACFESLAPALEQRGVEVINCTPGSALDVFPRMSIEDALAKPVRAQPSGEATSTRTPDS